MKTYILKQTNCMQGWDEAQTCRTEYSIVEEETIESLPTYYSEVSRCELSTQFGARLLAELLKGHIIIEEYSNLALNKSSYFVLGS